MLLGFLFTIFTISEIFHSAESESLEEALLLLVWVSPSLQCFWLVVVVLWPELGRLQPLLAPGLPLLGFLYGGELPSSVHHRGYFPFGPVLGR